MAPSADNSSTLKRIFQIVCGKRDTKTTFTVGLFSLILSLFCKAISFLIGIFSVVGGVYAFSSILWTSATIVSNTISIIFALMLFLMGIMLTLIFHVVSVEMEKTNDKNVIFQAFSGMAALVALIVALVALYKKTINRWGGIIMQTVFELCKPRDSVFLDTTRDDVLNLSDLVEGRIDADKFFGENFKTKGMEILFDTVFKRFQGKSDTGVISSHKQWAAAKPITCLLSPYLRRTPHGGENYLGAIMTT